MSWSYALAKELYGTPWFVDAQSLPAMMGTLNAIRNGAVLEVPKVRLNTPNVLLVGNDTKLITRSWQLDNKDNFEGIGIINIDGAITLSGGASSMGMEELSNMMYEMASDDRITSFIVRANSGGGASGAVDTMKDAIREIDKIKPVYGSVKKGGMAASAMYGILTATRKIYSESKMNIVGSNGTMIEFEGKAANTVNSEGVKLIRIYASKSTMKNKAFEEALNNDNYELLINELLDPINENFLEGNLQDRPQLAGSNYDNGHTVFAKDAIGTFIDGIATFSQVVSMLQEEVKLKPSINNNSNLKKMNREELKNSHPEVFNEVRNEGVIAEQERVKCWMIFQKADSVAVAEGINSGKDITPSQQMELTTKMFGANQLELLKSDSAKNLVTAETKTNIPAEENPEAKKATEEAEAAMKFELK